MKKKCDYTKKQTKNTLNFSSCIDMHSFIELVTGVLSLLHGKLGFYDTYSDPTGNTGYSFDFACIELFVCYIEPLIIVLIKNQSTCQRVNKINKSIFKIYKLDEFFPPMYPIENVLCVETKIATY